LLRLNTALIYKTLFRASTRLRSNPTAKLLFGCTRVEWLQQKLAIKFAFTLPAMFCFTGWTRRVKIRLAKMIIVSGPTTMGHSYVREFAEP